MREFKDSISGDNNGDRRAAAGAHHRLRADRFGRRRRQLLAQERERLRALLDQADERETRAN
jgi:hypothetical protein